MDELNNIDCIRGIFYDEEDNYFYTVSNKKNNKLGFFLTRYKCNDIANYEEIVVLKNKLNIDDVTLQIVRGEDLSGKPYKELVIGYKTIYINTYQVTIQDLSASTSLSTFCRHESYHLWETKIFGLMITSKTKDFITLSKAGMNVLNLGTRELRRVLDFEGQNKFMHSIVSFDFLKVEQTNLINFKCQDYDNRIVSIE